MTATTTVALNVTGNANQQIKSIETNINGLSTAFSKLGGLIAGLAIGSFVTNLALAADKIVDLSNALGVTAGQVAGLGAAFVQNGGDAEGAQMAYIRLSKAIYEARDGSDEMREAFKQLGVSQQQLQSSDLQGSMRATIAGLAAMGTSADTTGLSMKMLGKANNTVNFQTLNAGLDGFISKASEAEKPMNDLAQIIDNIKAIGNTFGIEMMKNSEGLIGLLKQLTTNTESIAKSLAQVTNIVLLFGSAWLIFYKLLPGINKGMTMLEGALTAKKSVLGYLTAGLYGAYNGMLRLGSGVGKITEAAGKAATAWTTVQQVFFTFTGILAALARTFLRFNMVIAIIFGVAETIQFLGKTLFNFDIGAWINKITRIGDAFDWLKGKARSGLEWLGILDGKTPEVEPPANKPPANDRRMNDIPAVWKESPQEKAAREERERAAVEQVKLANDLQQSLSKVRLSYMQLGEESQHNNDILVSNLKFETSLIGKTEEQVQLARALRAEADSLINLKDQLSKKAQEINAEVVGELELQKKLNELQLTSKTSKEKDIAVSKNKVIVLESEKAEIDKLIGVYQNMNTQNGAAIEKYITQQQRLKLLEKDRLQNIENITKAIEDQVARQQTLAGILQGINDKKVDQGFETAQAGRNPLEKQMAQIQENARKGALEAGRAFSAGFQDMDLSAAQAKELADGLDQIAKSYEGIAKSQMDNLAASRSWEQGWKTAFDSYMDNATNAATKAGEVFSTITSKMNSAIDNFVENGKFSFEDLAKSIIKDLIKIELKAQAVKLLGMLGGGGGGGIFSAISSLFGFAEGGNPPINKPSIVGEKGPELFVPRSAGTIIPNGAGGGGVVNKTYITNNISAIDSKSVAQMFAENRKALLGTVQLAQKELPYGNR